MKTTEARFQYKQDFNIVEGDDDGILDVPQIGQYRTQQPVPAHVFERERLLALAPDTPTGFIALDISQVLGTTFPATTPLLLCRYLVLRAGVGFSHQLRATGQVFYVMRGSGTSRSAGREFKWATGDVFVFPCGEVSHQASKDALLFVATDEPELSYFSAQPLPGPVLPAYFSADRIEERLSTIYSKNEQHQAAGKFVTFYTRPMANMRSMLPAMNASLNSLEPGGNQRPHHHNAVAVTLSIQGEGVYSMVDGQKVPWPEFGAFITPPASEHSHHNAGSKEMRAFVVQDSGFHSYCRTPGFAYTQD